MRLIVLAMGLACLAPLDVRGQEQSSLAGVTQLEELNRQILLNEIALERYAIQFRSANNFQGRWKGWRYFLTQETNNLTTAGGLMYQLAERVRIFNVPYTFQAVKVTSTNKKSGKTTSREEIAPVLQKTRRSKIEAGYYPQLVGQFLAGAGSSLEMGLNHYHQHLCNIHGYGCKDSIREIRGCKDKIDGLLAQRDAIISGGGLKEDEAAVARAETAVLKDSIGLALKEYEDSHVSARRFRTLQDSLYVFDIARNGTGAAGNIVGIIASHEGSAYLGGPTNVMTTISGALGVLTPSVSRLVGKLEGDHHRKFIERGIGPFFCCNADSYDMDRKNLQNLIDAKKSRGELVSEKAAALFASYEGAAAERSEQLQLAQRDLRAGTRAAQENITVGSINGLTKVTIGITGVIAGYGLTTSNHRGNDVVIPGLATYIAGTWLSAGENIRLRVLDEVNRSRLGKQGLLPGQVLAARLKKLDEVQKTLQFSQ